MTSQLQVLDVVVNKPFKDRLHRLYGEWGMAAIWELSTNTSRKHKKHCLGVVLRLLGMTFHQNPSSRGFKKCCVSNDMNGTEDDGPVGERS
jgi:phosphoenolpyruvate synthase/pyruvate phosphate dikinase